MSPSPAPPAPGGDRPDSADQALLVGGEAQLRSIVAAMAEGVVLQGADGRIVACNGAAERILGLTRAQLGALPPASARWRLIREDGSSLPPDEYPMATTLRTGEPVPRSVLGLHRPDGALTWVSVNTALVPGRGGAAPGVLATFSDVTEQVRRERVAAARLRLLDLASRCTLRELLTAVLDEAEALTWSQIGFFHFVDEDQSSLFLQAWSTNTLARMCTAEGSGQHYPVAQAGVWADAVRERRATVHNDYAALEQRKGMPPGHATVHREVVVPVLRDGRVCAVLGVGNKATDYAAEDVEVVSLLADEAWDIAARMRADEALAASEERLRIQQARLDLAASSGSIGLWDLDLRTSQAWRTLQHDRLFGYDDLQPAWGPAEALRHVVPEDRAVFQRAFDEAFATGRFHYELRIEPLGQPQRWIEAHGTVFRDSTGAPVRMLGTVADVTQRRQAEDQVAAAAAYARSLIEASLDPLVMVGPDGRITDVNRATELATGHPRDRLLGADFASAFTEPERARSAYRQALAVGEIHDCPLTLLHAGGRTTEVVVNASVYRGRDGEVAGVFAAARDLTEIRALQGKLALAARLAATGALVARIGHEVNNPLAAELADEALALEGVRTVRERLGPGSAERPLLDKVIEDLEEAQSSGRRIAQIVKSFQTFGRSFPDRSRVRLLDVVNQALGWLPPAVGRSAQVTVEDGGAPDVLAAFGQLEQVVVCLVTNAAQATRPGTSGVVIVRLVPGAPGRARLEVIDHGTGIPPGIRDRVFEPFFTTRDVGKGMGLGLATSHAIVTAHGGEISVESVVGQGSTFRIELPAAPPPDPGAPPVSAEAGRGR